MFIIQEGVSPLDVAVNAADRQVHLAQLPGGVVGFLAIDGEVRLGLAAVAVAGGVGLDEFPGLHEHAAAAAAGVIDPAGEGFQHLHQQTDNALRGIEFTAALTF